MYFTSGNVVNKDIKDIGFTPGSSSNKYTTFKSSCPHVGVGEVSSEEVGPTLTNCVTGKLKFLY